MNEERPQAPRATARDGSGGGSDIARRLSQERVRRGRSRRPRIVLAILIALIAIALGAVIWVLSTGVPEDFPPASAGIEGSALPPQQARELYFGAPDMTGLVRETRFLPVTGALDRDARAVVEALIAGSLRGAVSPWPPETRIAELFVTRAGIAYIGFDVSVRWLSPAGDAVEWLLAASLTRSLCANFPELRGVRVQIEGASSGPWIRQIPLDWTLTPEMFEVKS